MILHWMLFIGQAWAEEGHGAATGAHVDHGIPWTSIFVQTFNISFLLILLTVLLRKSVKAHFANRAHEYHQLVSRAEAARVEAEKGKREVKERLAKLEAASGQVLERARTESEDLRNRMMAEAKAIALRLQQEAERTVKVEVEKAKAHMRKDLLQKAIADSRENFKKNMSSSEQQKLQREFAEKIQVVGG